MAVRSQEPLLGSLPWGGLVQLLALLPWLHDLALVKLQGFVTSSKVVLVLFKCPPEDIRWG